MRGAALILLATFASPPAARALTERDLAQVTVSPPPHARLDLSLAVRDTGGRATTLGAAADGAPAVFVFADYRCRYLCGPALSLTADALARTGLQPGRDYRLLVLGLDPRETPAEAAAFGAARLAPVPQVRAATALFTGSAVVIARAAGALGYRYRYDPATGQFAHMSTAFVLTADGRLVAALSNIQLQPATLAAAVRRAGRGEGPSLASRLHALCYPFDPARGVYDQAVERGLQLVAAGLLVIAGLAAWRLRRARRS